MRPLALTACSVPKDFAGGGSSLASSLRVALAVSLR